MNDVENAETDTFGSYCALLVAFKTMKERCQQLQMRLAVVEEENMCLRLECGRDMTAPVVKVDKSDRSVLQTLQVRQVRLDNKQVKILINLLQYLRHNVDCKIYFSRILKSEKSAFSIQ